MVSKSKFLAAALASLVVFCGSQLLAAQPGGFQQPSNPAPQPIKKQNKTKGQQKCGTCPVQPKCGSYPVQPKCGSYPVQPVVNKKQKTCAPSKTIQDQAPQCKTTTVSKPKIIQSQRPTPQKKPSFVNRQQGQRFQQ